MTATYALLIIPAIMVGQSATATIIDKAPVNFLGAFIRSSVGSRTTWRDYASSCTEYLRDCRGSLSLAEIDRALDVSAIAFALPLWGVISVSGQDRLHFLHNQLTNEFNGVRPGTVLEACYTTPTDRDVLLLTSPARQEYVEQRLNKYIFPLDRVEVRSVEDLSSVYVVAGSAAADLITQLLQEPSSLPDVNLFHSSMLHGNKGDALVAASTGLGLSGYTLIGGGTLREHIESTFLRDTGGVRIARAEEWEQGRPYPGSELTESVTPLEAGLYHAVNFEKGCYLGQETISKVANSKGERQKLYGIEVHDSRELKKGSRLLDATGSRAGMITSVSPLQPSLGLAYIRRAIANPPERSDLRVEGEGVTIKVVDLPYSTWSSHPTTKLAEPDVKFSDREAISVTESQEHKKAAEAERKARKLDQMKLRMQEFQARAKQKSE